MSLHAAYTYAFLRRGELLAPLPLGPRTYDLGGPIDFWPALIATLLIEALLGVLLYVAVFRPLRNARPLAKAVASLGVMILLTAVVAERAGPDQILVQAIFPRDNLEIGGIRIVTDRLWFAVTIAVVTLGLAMVYRFTRFGIATRAAAETEVGALVTGLSPGAHRHGQLGHQRRSRRPCRSAHRSAGAVDPRHLHPLHRAGARCRGARSLLGVARRRSSAASSSARSSRWRSS